MKKVYNAIVDLASEEYVQYVIESYVAAYASLKGYDADYILEEILCDYEAGMNIFSKENIPDSFWAMSKDILQSDSVKADPVRGPPTDGRTSRETRKINTFLRHFTGEVREGEYIYLSNIEKATIKSNIKTGFGHIAPDAKRGIVSAHDRSRGYTYHFVCNTDYSVTVIDVLDDVADRTIIDSLLKEVTGNDNTGVRRSGKSTGKEGHGSNYRSDDGGTYEKTQSKKSTAEVDDGTPEINRERDSGSGGENRTNSGADTAWNASKIKFSRETSRTNEQQEVDENGRREETREAFYRRAYEAKYTVRERGQIACGYNPVSNQTERAEQTKKELEKLGIQVIVHEGLEVNTDGVTRDVLGDATSIAGDAVYVRNSMETDPVETAGHEAFHFWKHTDARLAYREVVEDNIIFSSDSFIQFQEKIGQAYFDDETEINGDDWAKLAEEIFAYITGLIYAGDSKNIVRPFIRAYDAVKAAWDALVESQSHKQTQIRKFSREFVQEQMTEKEKLQEKINSTLEQENAKLKEDVQYLKELLKLQRTVTGGTKFTKPSVEAAARMLKQSANAKGDTAQLAKLLNSFYEQIATGKELTWETVKELAQPAVDWLQSNVNIKPEHSEYVQAIIAHHTIG